MFRVVFRGICVLQFLSRVYYSVHWVELIGYMVHVFCIHNDFSSVLDLLFTEIYILKSLSTMVDFLVHIFLKYAIGMYKFRNVLFPGKLNLLFVLSSPPYL